MIVIAHRGACGYRPEHTLEAYRLAIKQGADFIEPDLVATKDGVLISRHENNLKDTTDVADHAEFADRKKTVEIDGEKKTGWFSEDFTLQEIKTLRAKERIPKIRPANTKYDGQFEIATFADVIDLAAKAGVGIYPETKHPTYFSKLGFNLGEMIVKQLVAAKFTDPKRVFIQSFEAGNLVELKEVIMPKYGVEFPLVQLLGSLGTRQDHGITYGDMVTENGLKAIRSYAVGIGPKKESFLPRKDGRLTGEVHPFFARAKKLGLLVYPYTIRAEKHYQAIDKDGKQQTVRDELKQLFDLGVDGVFIEQPDEAVAVLAKR